MNPLTLLRQLEQKSETYWISRGNRMALQLFKRMAIRVPAYKDFLKKNHIDAKKIKTITDFQQVPTIDKQNYLRQYPLNQLCWDGKFQQESWVLSSTSGSTGEPFYFPRTQDQDWQYALTAELYLRTNFAIHKKTTLYIDAFPMGPWIGGLFTYQAIRYVAERGKYSLSIITTGIDKAEIIRTVKKFGKQFDQIIIGCYGPFLKDTLDDGIHEGINWKEYNLKFIFSAEGFSESFRDYVCDVAGLKNPCRDTLNHYGTVDLGTMSYETPLSILIRRTALKNPSLYCELLPVEHKLPTLTQFMPEMFNFEEVNGTLFCSAPSGIPLVRYNLKDHGGIISYEHAMGIFDKFNIDLHKETKKEKIDDTVWRLPFVYVYERSDFSISFYAFQIYPETVRRALFDTELHASLTGKFSMLTKFDDNQNQYIEVNVELKRNIQSSSELTKKIQTSITNRLLEESSEYRETHREIGGRVIPRIVFWPYEDMKFFKPGTKQKWTMK